MYILIYTQLPYYPNMKVAYTTGTYDIVHSGHFNMLEFIRTYGYERIIVGLVTDEFAMLRKRKTVLSYEHRRSILENSKYNVFVVPCTKSDKVLDYKKLKFDALFITDEYFECDEYSDFSKEYPLIPIYYAPRVSTGPSTSKLIQHLCNNIEYINESTICIHGQKIQILRDRKLFDIVNECTDLNGSSLELKLGDGQSNTIWWWYLPTISQEQSDGSEWKYHLDKKCVIYNGVNFEIRETQNSWDKYKSIHLTITQERFPRSEFMTQYYTRPTEKLKSLKLIETIRERLINENYLILLNDYPYDTPMYTDHYIFWFGGIGDQRDITMESALSIFKEFINYDDKKMEVVIFCNNPNNKSIPDVNHYHIVINKNNKVLTN